jgi:ATP-binding cassette subfamily B protein
MHGASVRAASLSAVFQPVILMFGSIATALILVRGSGFVMAGAMQLGVLSALVSYAVGVFDPIRQVTRIFNDVVATQANIERVLGLLETEPMIADSPEVVEKYGDSFKPKRENWEEITGHIQFEDVTFQYPDGHENVLEHFHLDVPAGACVAIVGETGAGKSTLVNLVCRFFEPTGGRILIDGRDYRERSQRAHSSIGYVLQAALFYGTVRDNIRYGGSSHRRGDLAAARLVRQIR